MRPLYSLGLIAALVLQGYTPVQAEAPDGRRGLVTSGQCPLTCRRLGVDPENCREWQQGTKCMVEDFTQPAGHRSVINVSPQDMIIEQKPKKEETQTDALLEGRRGLVTSASCPYNCAIAGIPQDNCREWQQGNTCMVEDFMQPAGHRSMLRVP